MRRSLVVAVALATCLASLGAPAALAQDDGASTEPTATTTTDESTPTEEPEPTTEPEPDPTTEPEPDPTTEPEPEPGIDPFIAFTPSSAAPGQQVRVQVGCDEADSSFVESPALYLVELSSDPDGHMPWALFGTTTVPEWVKPGTYPVFSECGSQPLEATFTVVPAPGDGDQGDDDQVSRTPKGAPETGGGSQSDALAVLLAGLTGLGALAGAGMLAARRAVRR